MTLNDTQIFIRVGRRAGLKLDTNIIGIYTWVSGAPTPVKTTSSINASSPFTKTARTTVVIVGVVGSFIGGVLLTIGCFFCTRNIKEIIIFKKYCKSQGKKLCANRK